MNKILRCLWLGALALTVGFTACSDDEDPAPAPIDAPEIAISGVTATASSAEFTLTPKNAVRYTYAVAPKGETGEAVEVKSDKASTQQAEGLDADRVYTITAVAYAADGTKSTAATHDFTTNAKATVVIGEKIIVTFFDAKLSLTPTNATSVSYTYYPAAQKPAEPEWTRIEGNDPATVTLDDLQPDTEYLLEAYASNAEGDGKIVTSPAFRTDPAPTVEIGEVTVTANSASVTLTPAHADGLKYACYASGQRPSEPVWTDVQKSEATDVAVDGLTPNTEYVIEAYAYTAAGNGKAVTSTPFRTAEAPALALMTAVTSNAVWVRFEMNPDKTAAYYFSSPIDPTDEWAEFTTAEGFLDDIKENGWAYDLKTESSEFVAQAMPTTVYKLFAVCADASGNADSETVQEITVTTTTMDRTGTGSSTVQIGNIQPGSTSLEADFTFSENCIMYISGTLLKSDVDRVGGVNIFVNMNLSTFYPESAAEQTNPLTFTSLMPDTDYFVFAVSIDRAGQFGAIVSEPVRTTAVSYDPAVTAELSVYRQGFTDMVFDVKLTGADIIRYRNMLKSDFTSMYENDEEQVYAELFSEMADQMYLDDNNRFQMEWLTYNSDYILFVLPVKDDGSFGTRGKISYKTGKFEATGSSTVTFENLVTTPEGGGTVTLTPASTCVKFVYMELSQEVYEQYSRKLGEYVMSSGYYTTIDPAEPTDVEVVLWGEDTYLVAIACDVDGNWSEPVYQRFIYPAQ